MYKFQNSATFADQNEDPTLHESYWNISMESMRRFLFDFLDKIPTRNLDLSRATLARRYLLEMSAKKLYANT